MGMFNKLVNVIFPPKCIFCQQLLGHDVTLHICEPCYKQLPFMGERSFYTSQDGENSSCDSAISIFEYTGKVKESLIRFKFHNKPGNYRTYARLMAERLRKMADTEQYDMVLSVPLHRKREFTRGYNQAFLISKALSRVLKMPECSGLLKRIRFTDTQSLLDKQKRHHNVKGAFGVTAPERIKGKAVLLVDDILTTGSTLDECARVLKQAGAIKVTAIVVATGRKY